MGELTPPASTETDWQRLIEEIRNFNAGIRDMPVLTPVAPSEIRKELDERYSFRSGIPLDDVVADVTGLLRKWTIHVTHPRYFGLFIPSVREAGIAADALAALYNPQLAAWSHAPAANEIERHTLRHLAGALGMNPDALAANFTTGGAEANLSAVLSALAHHFPEAGEHGLAGLEARPAIYVTSESHHSFVKVARMAGLGTRALREAAVTDRFTLDPDALRQLIERDRRDGWYPLMIVGTLGTTGGGLIDPLVELSEIAAESGAWFHVDGAWGAAAALSPRLKSVVAGTERADSVTWDAHKWLSVPLGAGMFFCRHPEAVQRAFAVTASYMPDQRTGQTTEPYVSTVQWTRRFIGLKVFMSIAELGFDGYGELIDHQARMGDHLRDRLQESGWRIANRTPLPVVCFTHPHIQTGRITTKDLLSVIYDRGRVWISDVSLGGGKPVLRACITSYHSDVSDIECLIDEIENARRTCIADLAASTWAASSGGAKPQTHS